MIKAVIFDVDGVLIDSFEANLKFFQNLLGFAGYNPPTRDVYRKMFYLPMYDVIKVLINSEDENEIQRIWAMGKKKVVKYPDNLLTTPTNYEKVLKSLSQKYLLGIVTSRVSGSLFKLPQFKNLENLFKAVIYYDDTLKHKPDPEPLLLASKRLNIIPQDSVYVGDTISDIQAAKAAGMKALLYSKVKLNGADIWTADFDKLTQLIASLK
jgi:HAD superfamily hydrolase (TIGR01549 family)